MKNVGMALVVCGCMLSGAVWAQETGGVKIGGDATINASGKNITTQGEQNSTASTGVGVVRGNTSVGGDVEINASAENVTTKAANNSCAETTIGGVGSGPCQK